MALRRTRLGWETLSDGYRGRLEHGGIDQGAYERGDSLKTARGHRATPEKPFEAERNPEIYREYREKHQQRYQVSQDQKADLVEQVKRHAHRLFDNYSIKVSMDTIFKRIEGDPADSNFPGMTVHQLREALTMDQADWIERAHRRYASNPWFYH